MEIDADIQKLLTTVESGQHSISIAIHQYLESLPGYQNGLHRSITINKYERGLHKDPRYNFQKYLNDQGVSFIEEIKKEHLEKYKNWLLNTLDVNSVRNYITPVRQLMEFMKLLGWIENDYSKDFHLPKFKTKKPIRTIPKEIQEQVLDGDWGLNSFTIARNHLVACLLLKRGLHPLEFPKLRERHIHPYNDLGYLEIYGKRDAERDVMLDDVTFKALQIYMVERAHFLHINKIHDDHIFLSLISRNDTYAISIAGVQAIVRRIKQELRLQGCLWDLTALNPQGCRRSAVSNDYEQAEYLPVQHPEFTLSGQYGHSLEIAQKHYWKKSLKNAYKMVKGQLYVEGPLSENADKSQSGPRSIFPQGSFFRDIGIGI